MSDQQRFWATGVVERSLWTERFRPLDRTLWGVVIAASMADLTLTLVGLELCFQEANPVAATAIEHLGPFGLVLLKAAALLVLFGVARRLSRKYTLAALAGFSLPQVVATGMNSVLLLTQSGACGVA